MSTTTNAEPGGPIDLEDAHVMPPRCVLESRLSELKIAIRICRLLIGRWVSLHELAGDLNLTSRTVRRYIYALQAVGLDIVERKPTRFGAMHYRLDRRSWHGLPYLPQD